MIKILNYTKSPLGVIGYSAGICYDSIKTQEIIESAKDKTARGIALHCLNSGHTRTAEFADLTILIDGYSARVMRELYTHIIGTSRVQASTRYIKYYGDKFGYYIPNSIKANEQALNEYEDIMDEISLAYKRLLDLGIRQEDVANILPLGHNSTMTLKINVRALMHLYSVRTCTRAYEEFRKFMKELSDEIRKLDDPQWSELLEKFFVTKCEFMGYCDEGNCCGKAPRKEDVMKLIALNKKDLIKK